MEGLIYTLCTLTSLSCAYLLLRSYFRTRYGLLFWSGLCFAGLTVNNGIVVVDKLILPEMDLTMLRLVTGLVSLLLLLFGLIWEKE
jgi:uncharacterized protein DUF5985